MEKPKYEYLSRCFLCERCQQPIHDEDTAGQAEYKYHLAILCGTCYDITVHENELKYSTK